MHDVHVLDVEGSESGVTTVDLTFPGGQATCWIDRDYDIHDIHFSRAPERTYHKKESVKGNASAQEQACAAHIADEMNERMSSVRVTSSNDFLFGSRQVNLSAPGMNAKCTADVHNNVVYFKFVSPGY